MALSKSPNTARSHVMKREVVLARQSVSAGMSSVGVSTVVSTGMRAKRSSSSRETTEDGRRRARARREIASSSRAGGV